MDTSENERHEHEQKLIKNTSGYKKILAYLHSLTEDKNFLKQIKRLRKKCNLPENGLTEYIFYTSPETGKKYIDCPDCMRGTNYIPDLDKICNDYGLDIFWRQLLEHYLTYNNFDLDIMVYPFAIEDINYLLNNTFPEPKIFEDEESNLDTAKLQAKTHPIALFIHPYASQRELIDYVKKMFKTSIEPLQKRYQKEHIKLGKVRTKSERIKQRNNFILQNKHLPKKELIHLVANNFGDILSHDYVNKIISDHENK